MTDYRDDWKYSKPIPKEPTRRAYEEGWERVFGVKFTPMRDVGPVENFEEIPWYSLSPDGELKKMRGPGQ